MDKVYVVVDGEYSDYHICKIFTDEILAEKYCALCNKDDYDKYRIEEFDITTEKDIEFSDQEYGICVDVIIPMHEGDAEIYEKKYSYKIKNEVQEWLKKEYWVKIFVNKNATDEQIIKIAYDELAKYIAKEVGVIF